ncbi:sialic acid-induced transmembrane protein YjhT [Vibrio vulnificus]|uniref:YjhT family mutarotase n=1 Tax=Vibrio vulnificus TaxID=672 RepID=UPI000C9DDD83|nr:YjhT family mutarotase [Vibrio vulnificus]PNM98978.1 N-acetylneuraminic acid mutarotase [Vibrio vulnificus]SUQ30427.1 sialic acid-induced transmembrane protein YjhT [Vibrio vulnificus]HAS8219450.1 YjhT family mutarotase [Vibrio vulnificus]HAS8275960.1 YjhT family mutarotase [Vibrio vulnificus]
MLNIRETFPALPIGIKNGIAARVGDRIFVGLGSAGQQLFYLEDSKREQGWKHAPEFPGCQRNDAVCIAVADGLYVFSGAGQPEVAVTTQVLMDGYFFNAELWCWQAIQTPPPVGLLGASGCEWQQGQLAFWGGYNKETFDSFVAELSDVAPGSDAHRSLLEAFMSQPVHAYGWNQSIIGFDCQTHQWRELSINPYSANCGASILHYQDNYLLIEGEIKPGLRSVTTKQYRFCTNGEVECNRFPSIIDKQALHEGLAGAFAGTNQHQLLVAGGAYFVGSQENYKKGQWYSHKGLIKHYSRDIWCFDGEGWSCVGLLPQGLAYGCSVMMENTLLLLGGENSQGEATKQVYAIELE